MTCKSNKHPDITQDLFLKWHSPRFGESNPTCHTNPVWEWLIRSRLSAYSAKMELGLPYSCAEGLTWSFDRFGQSRTVKPDGRTIFIAGEHEDSYDPDFCIYNDVVVHNPNDTIDIYGYPKDIFPPTDFHTATRVDNHIYIIGNLGYLESRQPGFTPVFSLNIENYKISRIKTSGSHPGWIYQHKAVFLKNQNAIVISDGNMYCDKKKTYFENTDTWELSLNELAWKKSVQRNWPQWIVKRSDGKPNYLFHFRTAPEYKEVRMNESFQEELDFLRKAINTKPDFSLFNELYRPPISHILLPDEEDDFIIHRIDVNGTEVRYTENIDHVSVCVEGELPESTITLLKNDVKDKLSKLENTQYIIIEKS